MSDPRWTTNHSHNTHTENFYKIDGTSVTVYGEVDEQAANRRTALLCATQLYIAQQAQAVPVGGDTVGEIMEGLLGLLEPRPMWVTGLDPKTDTDINGNPL